jgi:hypothetical protein
MLIAKRVAALWPSGTTAFISIIPTHLFGPHATSLSPVSNYGPQFSVLGDYPDGTEGWLQRLERRLTLELARHSFLVRNQEWILQYLKACLMGGAKPIADDRNRTWNIDGDFALRRFRSLEATLAAGPVGNFRFSWVRSLEEVLSKQGIRPVFVLSPLNAALVHQYSDMRVSTEQTLTSSHDYLVRELLANGYSFVDLFRELDSASFADLLHTNSRGDDAIAGALSDWLRERKPAHNPGGQGLGAHSSHQDY